MVEMPSSADSRAQFSKMHSPARESLNIKASEPLPNSLHRILSLVSGFACTTQLIRRGCRGTQGDATLALRGMQGDALPLPGGDAGETHLHMKGMHRGTHRERPLIR